MRRILVAGADGTIGRAMVSAARNAGDDVVATTRRETNADGRATLLLDLSGAATDLTSLPSADIVYLCAAMTRFADCEANPALAEKINVLRTVELGQHFLTQGSFVVFLSSNAVFSGAGAAPDEGEVPDPTTTYGEQKCRTEQLLFDAASEAKSGGLAIVRLTKVLPADFPLVAQWHDSLRSGEPVRPLSDLMLCPISLSYVARALDIIARRRQSGVFHLSGREEISYAELAGALARRWGIAAALVQPATAAEAGIKLQWQPGHSSLGMIRTTASTGMLPQLLTDVIAEVVGG